ncbi:MAG: hypothetical protein HYZ37_09565 [Candidatus Solibacter usitatus]|nr:hypothetical protein [Candidatus Solibacter usitatus]
MGLIEATPAGYKEKGRFPIEDMGLPSWSHPVVAYGNLFIRNQGNVTCYKISA